MADQVAGDRIWVSGNHAESAASAKTITMPGTLASPNQILCGDDAAEPPTALATTGSVTTTGANDISISGNGYIYGLSINAGNNLNLQTLTTGGSIIEYDTCILSCGNNRSIITSAVANVFGKTTLRNCQLNFGGTGSTVLIGKDTRIIGGSLFAGSAQPTVIFSDFGDRTCSLLVCEGFDFSVAASTLNICSATGMLAAKRWIFRNCKLPSSWSGSLVSGTIAAPGVRVEMWNCDSTDTNYRMWIEEYEGSIKSETTLVRTGGASDGDTPISWKMVSAANAEYPLLMLISPEIVVPNTTTAASKTLTVEILRDSATNLTDAEIWLEVEYLGTSGFPLALFSDDAKTDILATAADQATSSATWTTTGMTNPNTQKLSVTFTPEEEGVYIARVYLAKASTTVYVDPLVTVS